MWLECGEYGTLDLCRTSPRFVFAKTPRDIPPCEAVLVVSVDGDCVRQRVKLPAGASGNRDAVLALSIDDLPF